MNAPQTPENVGNKPKPASITTAGDDAQGRTFTTSIEVKATPTLRTQSYNTAVVALECEIKAATRDWLHSFRAGQPNAEAFRRWHSK